MKVEDLDVPSRTRPRKGWRESSWGCERLSSLSWTPARGGGEGPYLTSSSKEEQGDYLRNIEIYRADLIPERNEWLRGVPVDGDSSASQSPGASKSEVPRLGRLPTQRERRVPQEIGHCSGCSGLPTLPDARSQQLAAKKEFVTNDETVSSPGRSKATSIEARVASGCDGRSVLNFTVVHRRARRNQPRENPIYSTLRS